MSATQAICDEVKTQVQSGDLVLSDRMRQLAARFSEVNREIDARLRRCNDFLGRGLRVEAIHQANLAPRLLDEIAHLTFPERTTWDEVTAQYGLPVAAVPDPNRAAEINRAFAEQQPLESLTKKLRALARSRASAADRLTVLHELVKLDADNPAWTDSLELFEAEAYRQLAAEGDQAIANNDPYICDLVYDKMTSSGWRTPAPADVLVRLARRILPMMCDKLEHAILANKRSDYLLLKDKLAARLKVAAYASETIASLQAARLIAQAEAADLAAYEEDQYHNMLAHVESLLQNPLAPTREVESAYAALVAYDRPLPKEFDKLYQKWERRIHQNQEKRFSYVAIGLILFGLIFIAGLILLIKR